MALRYFLPCMCFSMLLVFLFTMWHVSAQKSLSLRNTQRRCCLPAALQRPSCFSCKVASVSSRQEAGSVQKVSGLHEPRLKLPQRCRLLRQLPKVPVPWTAAGSKNICLEPQLKP